MGCCSSSDPELLHQLARSPFFFLDDNDNASHLHSLSKRFTQRQYSANEVLWKKDDSDATFNVIIEGEVRLEYNQDKQMVFISKQHRECFGLDSLEHEINRVHRMEYNCIAVTDLTVYQLSLMDLNSYWISHKLCHEKFIDSAILPISAYLQSIDVFSSINTHNASLLSSMFRWKKIHKNEILFEEGTLGEAFYIVAKGSVAVVVTIENPEMNTMKLNSAEEEDSNEFLVGGAQLNMLDPEKLQTIRDLELDDKAKDAAKKQNYNKVKGGDDIKENDENSRVVYEFKSGDYFGEVSLVIKIPRTATIKATQNTTLLELRKSDFQKFIPHNNAIKLELEQVAHERIAQSFRRYQIPLFNAVPLNMFHVLSKLSQIKYYKTGEVICDPESKERALYVIAHGNVGVYVTKQRLHNNKKEKDDKLSSPSNKKGDASPVPIKEKQSQQDLLQHDGNRKKVKRMSEKLDDSNVANEDHKKRISKHLLPSNVYLLANMSQRDKLNRELIRLSFISSKALHKNEEILAEDEELLDDEETEEKGSSSDTETEPTPAATPHEAAANSSEIITEPTKLKPKQIKQYPITPPPPNKRQAIDSLTVNIANTKQVIDEDKTGSNNTPSFHSRYHTHAGFNTPSDDKSDKLTPSSSKKKKKKNKKNRRKSENALFRMKITSPTIEKREIFTRNEKFVRIADLMIPDENVDKLRSISRRGSMVSQVGKQFNTKDRDGSISSLHSNANKHIGSPSIIRIDPSDPTAYENLDFAKAHTMTVRQWKTAQSDGNLLKSSTPNTSVDISHTNTQLSEMIKKQEKEHEEKLLQKKVAAINENNNEKKEEHKFEERIDEKGMKLRDFKSRDGDVIYTEIEVSVLGTGNFFGETSLMEEADENEDEYEELNKTPTSTQSNNEIEIGEIPAINTAIGSKPSVLDILNKNRESNIAQNGAHSAAPSSSYRVKSKKKIDIESRKTYRGSHTTFRCVTSCVIYSITKHSIDEFFRIVPAARPWFDIMLSKYNVSLDTVLHIPRAARYFTLFLESEYAQENIHYVLSVNEYKDAYDSSDALSQMEMAQIICNHFISDQGSQQINVSYAQRKYILDRIEDADIDKFIFDSTQKAIYTLLQRDCFPRFKQSHFFHEFLNEAENLALLTKEEYEMQIKEEENISNENRKHSKLLISKSATSVVKNYSIDPSKSINESCAFEGNELDDDDENGILNQRAKTFT